MSAGVLRDAARLMRGRAEASLAFIEGEGWWGVEGLESAFADAWGDDDTDLPGAAQDAEHLAAWTPQVALAVADLLDQHVTRIEETGFVGHVHESLLAVARAYLDSSSTP